MNHLRRFGLVVVLSCLLLPTRAQSAYGGANGINGGNRGQGGGLFGVTRRSFMGGPNVLAARYFQRSGLPLVNQQNLALGARADGNQLATNPATPRPEPAAAPAESSPALAQQSAAPTTPPANQPPYRRLRGRYVHAGR